MDERAVRREPQGREGDGELPRRPGEGRSFDAMRLAWIAFAIVAPIAPMR